MTLALREPAIHPEGNAIFGYDGGNHFARNGRARPRGVFCRRATKARREVEKHLWSQDAVETLLDGPVAKGVRKFRTPSGRTLTRTM